MVTKKKTKLDQILETSRRDIAEREKGYREKALKMYPHVCGRCGREFAGKTLKELTVHHRDHNHDYNPPDGSNWELLCLYCHDNEHQRQHEAIQGNTSSGNDTNEGATFNPFADLKSMLEEKK